MANSMTTRRGGKDLGVGLMGVEPEAVREDTRLDRIGSQASSLNPGRVVLSALAGVLWGAGFIVGLILLLLRTVLWTVPAWCFVAVRLGAQDALRDRRESGRSQ